MRYSSFLTKLLLHALASNSCKHGDRCSLMLACAAYIYITIYIFIHIHTYLSIYLPIYLSIYVVGLGFANMMLDDILPRGTSCKHPLSCKHFKNRDGTILLSGFFARFPKQQEGLGGEAPPRCHVARMNPLLSTPASNFCKNGDYNAVQGLGALPTK